MADVNTPKVQKILHAKAFAHVATIRPDGSPQASPMWFVWDGEYLKFTHATNRQKYRNIRRDPSFAALWSALKRTPEVPSMRRWPNAMVHPGAIPAIRG